MVKQFSYPTKIKKMKTGAKKEAAKKAFRETHRKDGSKRKSPKHAKKAAGSKKKGGKKKCVGSVHVKSYARKCPARK